MPVAKAVLASAQPGEQGDPVLATFAGSLKTAAQRVTWFTCRASAFAAITGGLADEATLPSPRTERARVRLAAEAAWQAFGRETGTPAAVLRLAGISGPGRNALMDVLQGRARRVIKPGQLFNRIHVDDIARTIDVAFSRRASGMFNVCDDEPSPAYHVVEFAVKLPGRERRRKSDSPRHKRR